MRRKRSLFRLELLNAMAFATVDHSSVVVPVVDLHVLTQSELYALSLASSSSASSSRCDDDVLIPKIDRSVFNESAGSRKQTFSRLRLAPRNSSNYKSALPPPRQSPPLEHESRQIITLLKQLFPSENYQNDDVFVPTPAQYKIPAALPPASVESAAVEASSTLGKRKRGRPRKDSYAVPPAVVTFGAADEANVGNAGVEIEKLGDEAKPAATFVLNGEGQLVVQSSQGKRKRGRPRKDEVRFRDENNAVTPVEKESVNKKVMKVEEGETVLVNSNDIVVDSDAVAANGDMMFGEELRRRTTGLESEAELLGFMEGMAGVWSSARRKRKTVMATELGDLLPKGWRILLSLKRNGGHKSIVVRRYVSPNGQEFLSCKEVSSYLDSYFTLGSQSKPVHSNENIQVSNKMVMGDGMQYDANCTYGDNNNNNNNGHELDGCSLMPITTMKSSEASGEVMGMPKKLDPIRSGRLETSLKNQELVEKDREPTSGTVAHYDLSPGFSRGNVNDILADCFGSYNDESVSLSYEEKSMKVDKNCFSDGLNNATRVCISSVDVPKVDIESDSNDVGKEHGADNSDNHQLTSTIEDLKIDDVENSGNGRSGISESHNGHDTIIDQQSTSEACSLAPSMLVESVHKRGSESGLYNTAIDDKICAVSNDVDSDSLAAICAPTCDDIGLSGSNDKAVSFGSCSNVQPLDGQSCISVNNATNTSCTAEEFSQEKSVASNSLTSYGNKQSLDDLKAGILTAKGPRVDRAKNYNDSVSVTFSNRVIENTGTISCIQQERNSTGYSVTSYANEHASVLKNMFCCNDITEELKQDETDLVCPSGYSQSHNLENNPNSTSSRSIEESNEQVKRSWSDEVLLGFSSTHSGLEMSAMTSTSKNNLGPSPVLPEDNQTFATCSGIFSRSVIDDKLIRGPVNDLGYPSVSEQIPGFVNNLNRGYSSTLWEQSVSEGTEKLRNNEAVTGFLNDCEPSADSMSELLWRIGGKNVQQSGLPDTSAFVQPSANYMNFDMLLGKDANGALSLNENFDNILSFEGLKSGGLEEFEHCLPPAQASSQLKDSNILSYDERTEQRFHSSSWPENETQPSMPNIASRSEMNSCVWCRNEFYHDYEARMQTGSMGFMCENCQGKFSGHVYFP